MTQDSALLELDADARETSPSSAFLAIGGSAAVSAVVEEFYARLLADPATAGFFASLTVDGLSSLKRHQILLLTKVLGGPDRYTGRDLASAHAGLGITTDAYRRVSLCLLTVMHDFKVPMDVLLAADGVLRGVEPMVVSAGPAAGAQR
ncbi:hypothetical protein GCM10023322_47220 [Rugosimonospora acidiphila]|uniref:Group 1 truncated hemoglobin n=1 Tax=Rugosimonospora acidiphila TaxID=556531 RepID=A0ABP9S3H1_9ACTN